MTTSSLALLSTSAPFLGNGWSELALASLETESLFFSTSLFTLSLVTTGAGGAGSCFEFGVLLREGWATAEGGGGSGWSL